MIDITSEEYYTPYQMICDSIDINNYYHFERDKSFTWGFYNRVGVYCFIEIRRNKIRFGYKDRITDKVSWDIYRDFKTVNTFLYILINLIIVESEYIIKLSTQLECDVLMFALNKYSDKYNIESTLLTIIINQTVK